MSSHQPSSRLSQPVPPLNQDTWRYAYQSVSGMAGRKGFDPASQGPFSEFYRLVWRPFWRQLHKVRIAHAGSFRRGSRAVDVVGCEHFCPAVRFPHLECPSLPVLLCESPVGHCPGYSNRVAWLARTMCPMYAAPPCSLLALSCRGGTFSSSSETWWTGAASRALWASGAHGVSACCQPARLQWRRGAAHRHLHLQFGACWGLTVAGQCALSTPCKLYQRSGMVC